MKRPQTCPRPHTKFVIARVMKEVQGEEKIMIHFSTEYELCRVEIAAVHSDDVLKTAEGSSFMVWERMANNVSSRLPTTSCGSDRLQ